MPEEMAQESTFSPKVCIAMISAAYGNEATIHVSCFSAEEIDDLFVSSGLVREQLHVDRRLQINRGRQLKMYRVWIQAKYKKITNKTH